MDYKQEAERLIELFRGHAFNLEQQPSSGETVYSKQAETYNAKACAAICVAEIIKNNVMEWPQHQLIYSPHKNDFWNKVLEHIKQL